ncbi:MAG: hypothetical protein ABSD20_11185 [Terriglobales bacterium]|jgi:hypothetical protein
MLPNGILRSVRCCSANRKTVPTLRKSNPVLRKGQYGARTSGNICGGYEVCGAGCDLLSVEDFGIYEIMFSGISEGENLLVVA